MRLTLSRLGGRFSLAELGGGLGDLGTLLPLLVALVAVNGLHPVPMLGMVGLAYLWSGFFFGLPVPIQPLKALSATAIALRLPASMVSTAGLIIGAILLALAFTGAGQWLAKLFPRAVIRGIQLGLGLLLVRTALGLILNDRANRALIGLSPSLTNLALTVVAGGLLFLFLRNRHLPAALVVVLFGIGMGFLSSSPGAMAANSGSPLSLPRPDLVAPALFLLVLPQLPLTLGNSVFACADTARDYFGEAARRVSPRNLLLSLGLMNLAAGLTGAVPLCHGSGGLTAHYRLGARTGGAVMMVGALFLLTLALPGDPLSYLRLVPLPVLGVLLAYVGVQHALLARDVEGRQPIAVVALIALLTLVTGNLGIGFSSGVALHGLFQAMSYCRRRRQ